MKRNPTKERLIDFRVMIPNDLEAIKVRTFTKFSFNPINWLIKIFISRKLNSNTIKER
jgi:hypothetical protein